MGFPFEQLLIWQKSMTLAKHVYKITANFPREEIYGLTSQMRRAAVSVPSNIAEGSQRSTQKDFSKFILTAKGSLAELRTQVFLVKELNYIPQKNWQEMLDLIVEIDKMLRAFNQKLTTR